MSEETTTIQSLTPQGSFESNGKTFYKFDCILENGLVGEVSALTQDRWNEGQEVMVKSHESTKWGPRLKLDKPGFSGVRSWDNVKTGSAPVKSNDDTTKSIVASWAVRCAMEAAGDPTQENYDSVVLHLARIALLARDTIKKEVQL